MWTDTDSSSSTNTVDVVDYKYNDDGIRVEKYSFSVAQDFLDTGAEQFYATDKKTTTYLVDSQNHTGYAQVLEEWAVEGSTATLTCYTLGDDIIAQTKSYWQWVDPQWELQSTGNTQYLLYDGHGSTRQLAEYDTEVTIADSFSYDAYGVLLQDKDNFPPNGAQAPGKVAQQATSMLYAGEHFDTDSQNYYLRARWYDSLSGRFNRMDPFAGNPQDPQSLHKYLYAHCNPVMNIDPTGEFSFIGGLLNIMTVMGYIMTAISFAVPLIKMGLAANNLVILTEIAGMIRNSPLDMVTQLLLRNQITQLAIQNIAKLFNAFGELIQTVLVTVVMMILTTLIIKAVFAAAGAAIRGISNTAIRVARGVGSSGDDIMQVQRIISKGEKIVDVVDEVKSLTFTTGKEHAVVKLADGSRAIVSGGSKSITFPASIRRILGHSHPYHQLATGPSKIDFKALERLGHTTSYLLEHGELYKFTTLAGR